MIEIYYNEDLYDSRQDVEFEELTTSDIPNKYTTTRDYTIVCVDKKIELFKIILIPIDYKDQISIKWNEGGIYNVSLLENFISFILSIKKKNIDLSQDDKNIKKMFLYDVLKSEIKKQALGEIFMLNYNSFRTRLSISDFINMVESYNCKFIQFESNICFFRKSDRSR